MTTLDTIVRLPTPATGRRSGSTSSPAADPSSSAAFQDVLAGTESETNRTADRNDERIAEPRRREPGDGRSDRPDSDPSAPAGLAHHLDPHAGSEVADDGDDGDTAITVFTLDDGHAHAFEATANHGGDAVRSPVEIEGSDVAPLATSPADVAPLAATPADGAPLAATPADGVELDADDVRTRPEAATATADAFSEVAGDASAGNEAGFPMTAETADEGASEAGLARSSEQPVRRSVDSPATASPATDADALSELVTADQAGPEAPPPAQPTDPGVRLAEHVEAQELLQRLERHRSSLDGSIELEIVSERFGDIRVQAIDGRDGIHLSLRGNGGDDRALGALAEELRREFERDGVDVAGLDVSAGNREQRGADHADGGRTASTTVGGDGHAADAGPTEAPDADTPTPGRLDLRL